MDGESVVTTAPPPTRCPADPACRRSFGGTTAQKNLNSHLKNVHTEYYRTYVRPIKGPKRINHDAYIRQKQKDPEKVKRHRLLARLRKQARKEQVECMKRQRSPSPPRAPDQGLLAIDMGNPYFVLESECGMFVGHTKGDLMRCDVVKMLEGLASNASRNVAAVAKIRNAIAVARSQEKEALAADYYRYRRALQDVETFAERQTSYQAELSHIRERRLAPEGFLDEQAVQVRVEELLERYAQRSKTGGESTGSDNGNHDKLDDRDGEGEPEGIVGDSEIR
ncbi:uncharacterized protein H6S33_005689 [Morchella sextelata]|uniref:uncharacterized protein n=1 Tax=Morchella sextelata TaxID=1174677 RepID=UPI001D042683|nr:uncharacterized protein H6S33_005689 [Morchella sextelata]KAH0613803.1 hypothetical protein H6S33_005689 [Morchella sextelata]